MAPLTAISLFSGVGMLDEGLRAGLGYLGITHRTACHVEREAHAAAVLVARMEEGSVDAAPIWSDVTTFDAAAWRGRVDCVVAGFPCQDLSVAGKRAGLDGHRSGLFYEVVRIATDSGAWLMFLENVGGIASATASVMDEAEGELDERAAARVVGELADLGWDAEWLHLSASDVGASHGRERWFCLAWRTVADADDDGGEVRRLPAAEGRLGQVDSLRSSGELAVAERIGRRQGRAESGRQQGRPNASRSGVQVADASATGRRHAPGCDESGLCGVEEQGGARRSECGRDALGRPEFVGSVLADAGRPRPQGHELGRAHDRNGGGAGSTWTNCRIS